MFIVTFDLLVNSKGNWVLKDISLQGGQSSCYLKNVVSIVFETVCIRSTAQPSEMMMIMWASNANDVNVSDEHACLQIRIV
uniref:Ig-like domain-containing protein n=1 Tax=Panagrellus redivivus TaxID=6233 RepID=A0A7E4UMI2_PANRE